MPRAGRSFEEGRTYHVCNRAMTGQNPISRRGSQSVALAHDPLS